MRLAVLLIAVLAVELTAVTQPADYPHPVDEVTARKKMLEHPEPLYPPIAKAARVQGTVEIAVVINPAGKVSSEKVLTGPAMLQQAALDAVHKWTFTPFLLNGAPVTVSAVFAIPFQIDKPGEGPTKKQEEAAQAWFPISDKCRNALQANNADDSLNYCKQALDFAIIAGDTNSSDQIGLMLSHQYYGHALILEGRLDEALTEENTAVEESKKWLKETDQEYAMPFFWRAMAEVRLGQADATFADLRIAEETHRRAIAHLPEMKKTYSQYLASILRTHANLLDQVGRTEEAAKLRAEADSL
jgi:TonB family protein